MVNICSVKCLISPRDEHVQLASLLLSSVFSGPLLSDHQPVHLLFYLFREETKKKESAIQIPRFTLVLLLLSAHCYYAARHNIGKCFGIRSNFSRSWRTSSLPTRRGGDDIEMPRTKRKEQLDEKSHMVCAPVLALRAWPSYRYQTWFHDVHTIYRGLWEWTRKIPIFELRVCSKIWKSQHRVRDFEYVNILRSLTKKKKGNKKKKKELQPATQHV